MPVQNCYVAILSMHIQAMYRAWAGDRE